MIFVKNENLQWHPLQFANDTPIRNCRVGTLENLLASAWLELHTDHEAYDFSESIHLITPQYIKADEDPVLIVTRDNRLVEQPLMLGQSFTIDLFAPHALLPRYFANPIIKQGHDKDSFFQAWYDCLYDNDNDGIAPVLAWSTEPVTR
jgi:hypothetical protein